MRVEINEKPPQKCFILIRQYVSLDNTTVSKFYY